MGSQTSLLTDSEYLWHCQSDKSNPDTRTLRLPMTADWHPADVQAALKKAGHLLDQVGPSLGLHRSAGNKALHSKPWPRVKAKIASLLGIPPHEIWPSVFDKNDEPYPVRRSKRSHGSSIPGNVYVPYKAGGRAA